MRKRCAVERGGDLCMMYADAAERPIGAPRLTTRYIPMCHLALYALRLSPSLHQYEIAVVASSVRRNLRLTAAAATRRAFWRTHTSAFLGHITTARISCPNEALPGFRYCLAFPVK